MKLASKICRISAGFGIVSLSSLFDLSEPKNKKKYSKICKKLMISWYMNLRAIIFFTVANGIFNCVVAVVFRLETEVRSGAAKMPRVIEISITWVVIFSEKGLRRITRILLVEDCRYANCRPFMNTSCFIILSNIFIYINAERESSLSDSYSNLNA